MRVPLSWLREFVPVEAPMDEIVTRLSTTGLAVEQVIRTGEGIQGVVVGKVLEISPHPNADKLVLVKADAGAGPLGIVCGARNFAVGDLVPVATVGATLPGDFTIGRREVRGEVSEGMLCSAKELGVSEDHTGIMVLDPDLRLGDDVVKALDLDDTIFDIDVTPNRPDCLSVLGVAREVAAIWRLPLTDPAPAVPEGAEPAASLATVTIEDEGGCPRYVARVITGVRPGAMSPWWVRRRLLACGMRPISAVVDATNYALLERGHPLHAFDLDKLAGRAIVVRAAKPGEKLETLDGAERALDPSDVMICDAERAVAVAGVMGGAETEVGESTTSVLLESAYFDPVRVLRTARRLGLRTEASVRFERRADPGAVRRAADRCAALIAGLAGGTVARDAIDAGKPPPAPPPVKLSVARANAAIGIDIAASDMSAILTSIGCDVSEKKGELTAQPPAWRGDLVIEEDLVEEIARLHGFDRVPVTLPSGGRAGGLSRSQQLRRLVRHALLGAGCSEAHTLSLISPRLPDVMELPPNHEWRSVLRLANPLSEDESILRPSLIPGLLSAARHNAARRVLPVRLFECGIVFAPSGEDLPVETLRAAWVLTGPGPEGWHDAGRTLDFYDAKGVLEALCSSLGIPDVVVERGEPRAPFHPARVASISLGETMVGTLAEIHPRVAEALDLPGRVAVCEIDLQPFLDAAQAARKIPLSRFPAVERDIALVVPEDVPATTVAGAIRTAAGDALERCELFDVYRGEQLGAGVRSLAFSLGFRTPERTLTDEEADAAMRRITDAARDAGWSVRD